MHTYPLALTLFHYENEMIISKMHIWPYVYVQQFTVCICSTWKCLLANSFKITFL